MLASLLSVVVNTSAPVYLGLRMASGVVLGNVQIKRLGTVRDGPFTSLFTTREVCVHLSKWLCHDCLTNYKGQHIKGNLTFALLALARANCLGMMNAKQTAQWKRWSCCSAAGKEAASQGTAQCSLYALCTEQVVKQRLNTSFECAELKSGLSPSSLCAQIYPSLLMGICFPFELFCIGVSTNCLCTK